MRIGIDFDHVLFDTEKFKQHLFDEIDRFDETYKQAENEDGVYMPKKHAEILGIPVERIHDTLHYAEKCLYSDVDALEQLPDRFETVIVSRGDQHFQSEKIEESGVLEYVQDYIVVQTQPKDRETGIDFLVDDSTMEHERVELPEKRRMVFDRSKHGVKYIVERVKRLDESRK